MKPLDKDSARKFVRALGIVGIALGVLALWRGGGRPTGIWSWLMGPIFDLGGNTGVAIFYVAIGLFLLAVTLRKDKE